MPTSMLVICSLISAIVTAATIVSVAVIALIAWCLWLRFNAKALERYGVDVLDKTPKIATSYRRPVPSIIVNPLRRRATTRKNRHLT